MTSITFSNAALTIAIQDDDGFNTVEVLEALKAFRLTAINHEPTAASVGYTAPVVDVTPVAEPEPAVAAAEAEPAVAAAEAESELTDIEKVYGKGFVYNDPFNPSLGFRQPVVGDIFLDPHPGNGSDVPAPRRKTTSGEYGPRLILTSRY